MLHKTFLFISEPPRPPSPPDLASPTGVSPNAFTLHWSAPRDNGGLAVQSYTVVVLNMGSTFCPGSSQTVHAGISPTATSLAVTDVPAGFQYQFRVVVFTSVFNTDSENSTIFSTTSAGNQHMARKLNGVPPHNFGAICRNLPILAVIVLAKKKIHKWIKKLQLCSACSELVSTGLKLAALAQVCHI